MTVTFLVLINNTRAYSSIPFRRRCRSLSEARYGASTRLLPRKIWICFNYYSQVKFALAAARELIADVGIHAGLPAVLLCPFETPKN